MATIVHKGIKLAYDDRGAGKRAFVFVHGWTCDRSFFAPQAEYFTRRRFIENMFLPTSDRRLVDDVLAMMAAPSHVAASAMRGGLALDGPAVAAQCYWGTPYEHLMVPVKEGLK